MYTPGIIAIPYVFWSWLNHTGSLEFKPAALVIFNLIISELLYLVAFQYYPFASDFYVMQIPAVFLIQDFLFFTLHKFFHVNKTAFNLVHSIHHESYDSFYAFHAHPLEHILLNLGTLFVPLCFVRVNQEALNMFICMEIYTAVVGHSPHGQPHELHHIYLNRRFGSVYLMDYLFGTF